MAVKCAARWRRLHALLRYAHAAALILFFLPAHVFSAQPDEAVPAITGQVTFLYYEDHVLEEAERFYASALGLEKTMDSAWVRFFQVTPTSFVALVQEGRGYHRVSDDKPVMLSLVTDDLDGWYLRLRERDVEILQHPDEQGTEGIRALLLADPGGYTVEVFQWQ